MLGWEFPPLFSGGLGVATFGLVKALSQKNDIRLIIPSAASSMELDNVSIIGLNKITKEEINLERLQFQFVFPNTEVHQLPIAVSPYHHLNTEIERAQWKKFELLREGKGSVEAINSIFSDQNVYGGNVMHKVYLFSKQ